MPPPGSTGWPIIGEHMHLLYSGPEKFINDRMKKYSPEVFKTSILGEKMVVFCGADGNRFLFSNDKHLATPWFPRSHLDPITTQTPATITKSHKQLAVMHRNFLHQILKLENVKQYVTTMDAMARQHVTADWAPFRQVKAYSLVKKYNFAVACNLFLSVQTSETVKSGKSTYCSNLHRHCEATRRTIHIVNLDPAAENFDYPVAMDIRELISLDDVMEELHLGPNGGLIYCMEHLEENLDDWLTEELDNYMDDDYLVFDCPGQIELFSHVPVLKNFVEHLKRKNFNVCVVYLLDSQFITDVTKFISGCMASLSAMVQLELPHVNILSKMDLVTNKKDIDNYLNPEPQLLLADLNQRMAPQFQKLNKSLIELVDQYSMVSFMLLDLRKESSIQYILSQIDNCIQYGEDADVKVKDFDAEEDD
nr:GPN-loop GTPase 3 [Ipomoea batatas]